MKCNTLITPALTPTDDDTLTLRDLVILVYFFLIRPGLHRTDISVLKGIKLN